MAITVLLLLIVVTVYSSWLGIRSPMHFEKYEFVVEKVTIYKQYYRLISSALLHRDFISLGINMFVMLLFGPDFMALLVVLGLPEFLIPFLFLLLYFGAVVGGNLISIFINKFNTGASSVGAFGAIIGLIFAMTVINPSSNIMLLILPIPIPSWIFSALLLAYLLYQVKNNRSRESDLGAALSGMVLAIVFAPGKLIENWWVFLLLMGPILAFLYLIYTRPDFLLVDDWFKKERAKVKVRKNQDGTVKLTRNQELDKLLDKVGKVGYDKLSQDEKNRLNDLSNR